MPPACSTPRPGAWEDRAGFWILPSKSGAPVGAEPWQQEATCPSGRTVPGFAACCDSSWTGPGFARRSFLVVNRRPQMPGNPAGSRQEPRSLCAHSGCHGSGAAPRCDVQWVCEGGARHQTGASPKCAGTCPSDRAPGHLLTAPCKLLTLASQRSQHDPYPQRCGFFISPALLSESSTTAGSWLRAAFGLLEESSGCGINPRVVAWERLGGVRDTRPLQQQGRIVFVSLNRSS